MRPQNGVWEEALDYEHLLKVFWQRADDIRDAGGSIFSGFPEGIRHSPKHEFCLLFGEADQFKKMIDISCLIALFSLRAKRFLCLDNKKGGEI